MYSLADMTTIKEDWGHSSNIVGVDLCLRAKVKHYCMFHHEPAYDDETLSTILQETKRYAEIVPVKAIPSRYLLLTIIWSSIFRGRQWRN